MWAETQAGTSAAFTSLSFPWISPQSFQNSSQEEPRELCKMPFCWLLEEVEDWWVFFFCSAF